MLAVISRVTDDAGVHQDADIEAIRIGYMDGSRGDVTTKGERLRMGSANDCDVVLQRGEVAGHHLDLLRWRHGMELRVMPGAARVYVNARPVRERALLRLGDVLSVGAAKLVLKQASDTVAHKSAAAAPRVEGEVSQVGLRVVSGPLSGRRIAIDRGMNLDSLTLPGGTGCLRLRPAEGAVAFDFVMAPGASLPCFNGVPAARGSLGNGDQIAWGNHRLVLEMPPPPPAPQVAPPSSDALAPVRSAGPQNEVWWLIATAALLALVIALLLLIRS
jgi:hypothetical protein